MRLLYLALLALAPSLGNAALMTMTFDGLDYDDDIQTHTENGITATQRGRYGDGRIYAPDGGMSLAWMDCSCPSAVEFITGSLFEPVSLLLKPVESDYCATCTEVLEAEGSEDPIPYIWISGFLNGTLVNTLGLYRPPGDYEPLPLDFLGVVDLLRVEVKNYLALGLDGRCSGSSCGFFRIDDVTVQSVPEPETLTLLAVGALGLLLGRKRLVRPRN